METTQAASILLLFASLYTDLIRQKIPNTLTLTAMFLGICLNGAVPGADRGMGFALQGLMAGMGIWIIPFILGGTGGGDVKLFGALGALSGSWAVFWISIYAALAGGAIALVLMARQGRWAALKGLVYNMGLSLYSRGPKSAPSGTGHIPYSVPAALGYAFFTFKGGLF